MDEYFGVFETIEKAKSFGFRELAHGARLFGHIPHVAPEAWFHQTFAPLNDDEIKSLESKLNGPLPESFALLLRLSNGLGLFAYSLMIHGRRTSYVRTGDAAWQPFCVLSGNTLERPERASAWQFFIGSYRNDGSLLSIDVRDGSTLRTKLRSNKIVKKWSSLATMLTEESNRLAELYDEFGRLKAG